MHIDQKTCASVLLCSNYLFNLNLKLHSPHSINFTLLSYSFPKMKIHNKNSIDRKTYILVYFKISLKLGSLVIPDFLLSPCFLSLLSSSFQGNNLGDTKRAYGQNSHSFQLLDSLSISSLYFPSLYSPLSFLSSFLLPPYSLSLS